MSGLASLSAAHPGAQLAASVAVLLAALLVCAACSKRPRAPGTLLAGLVAMLASLLAPPQWPVPRFAVTLFGCLAMGRAMDLAWRPHALSFRGRLWLLVTFLDVREPSRREPTLEHKERRWLAVHLLLFVASALALTGLAARRGGSPDLRTLPAFELALRWVLGAVQVYSLPELLQAVLLAGYAKLGLRFPKINREPIFSTTLAEFWGRRWNRAVAGWLRNYAYLPLARRGRPKLAVAAAFAASACLHFWVSFVPLGWLAGATMASFFLVHGAALALERALGVREWTPTQQRLWSYAWFALSLPLFVEPTLRVAGW